jgi:hypothetical protein
VRSDAQSARARVKPSPGALVFDIGDLLGFEVNGHLSEALRASVWAIFGTPGDIIPNSTSVKAGPCSDFSSMAGF